MTQVSDQANGLEAATMRRVSWRLMPFLMLSYLLCYIDRVNVGFASLEMNKAVGIDPKIYGLGAGIFFVRYFILEVPSNLALQRFGARKWIARIMVSWGVVSMACALIAGPWSRRRPWRPRPSSPSLTYFFRSDATSPRRGRGSRHGRHDQRHGYR